MRTTVELDEEIVERALRASGKRTKRELFEEALLLVIQRDAQRQLTRFRGSEPGAAAPPRRRGRE